MSVVFHFFCFKQKTAYEMRISDWSSDVCSSDLGVESGDVVSGQLPNWWQAIALHLAAMRIGAIVNPLMPIFRERELDFMLRLAEAKVLVAPERFRNFDHAGMIEALRPGLNRKSVVEGKGVYVSVDLGGRRIIKK